MIAYIEIIEILIVRRFDIILLANKQYHLYIYKKLEKLKVQMP